MGCVLLFLLNHAVSGAPTDYRTLLPATVTKRASVAYFLAKIGFLPVSLAKPEVAGLKSLPH